MIHQGEPDPQETEWLFNEDAIRHCAVSLREQMDTDFEGFLSAASRFREASKLKGARFGEGVFARLVSDGLRMQGLYGPSIDAAKQAKSLLTPFSKDREYLLSVRSLASGYAVSGNVDLGLKTYLDGFETAKILDLGQDTLVFAFDLCHWNREAGNFEAALTYLRYVSENLLPFCKNGLENILYSNYGEVYMDIGLVNEAEQMLEKGFAEGDPGVEEYFLYLHGAMACVRAAQERHEEASELLRKAQESSRKYADTRVTAWLGLRVGKTYIAFRHPDHSIPLLQDAIEHCESYQDDWLLVDLYESLTAAYKNMGDIESAFNALSTGHRILEYAHGQKMTRESAQMERLNYNWKSRESELQSEISEALIRSKEAAERASQFKSMFLTKMSHELRTPLNGVLGVTRMLLNRSLDSEERQLAQTIYSSGQHILSLVNSVLDLSKAESGTLPLLIQPFDLTDLASEIGALYGPLCSEKGIGLTIDLAEDLAVWVEGDRTRVNQVIANLVGNAIKSTAVGGVSVLVEQVAPEAEPQRVRFAVKDTGVGIAPEDQESIFTVFGQAGKSKFTGGAGLGLSISRELVALMGGTIGVISDIGKGSEFWFELPLPASHRAEDDAEVHEPDLDASSRAELQNGLKILVVEDDDINWMVLESMLDSLEASSVRVCNGKEAVDLFGQDRFDLVILDCHMDVMDGFEACAAMRRTETAGRVPILALSADVLEANQQRCFASGMDGFVGKPIQVGDLIEKVAEVAPKLVVQKASRSESDAGILAR